MWLIEQFRVIELKREIERKLLDEDENFDFLMLFPGRSVLNVIDLL